MRNDVHHEEAAAQGAFAMGKEAESRLSASLAEIEEVKTAFRVLLKQHQADRADMETSVLANVKESILPCLEKLKASTLNADQRDLVSLMESRLALITSPFIRQLSSEYLGLSPMERQVAALVREGKSSKEIARMLVVSLNTVMSHRSRIREKTGVKGTKVNLRTFLQGLE